jgi:Uma2 family endonuclease
MPLSPPIPPRSLWTVDDLEELPKDGNRYEILHGELLVTPRPTLWHQRVVTRLISSVGGWCNANRAWECFAPGGVPISQTSWLIPDLVVYAVPTSGLASEWHDMEPPTLVIEILSPSTRHIDRYRKRPAYLAHGVAEVWLVDIDARTFERWTARSEFPELHTNTITWSPNTDVSPLTIEFERLFAPPV